jgi:hypothetical protein
MCQLTGTSAEAVDAKIAEQFSFFAWWDTRVRGAGQPEKELAVLPANTLTRDQAEELYQHDCISTVSDLGAQT